MDKTEKFHELLQNTALDIRLEVILTDLVLEGLSMEDVIVIPNSLFKRNYHHDIENTVEMEYGNSKKKKLCIVINREGIYDQLPEDLFHQPSDSINNLDKESIVSEIKIQNELEKASRLFFLPFENEFYRQRIRLESEERKFLFETNSDLSGELFNYLWDLPDFLDNFQKSKLGMLFPVLNMMVGDFEMATFLFERITGDHIQLENSLPRKHILNDDPLLGNSKLGVDTIFSGEVTDLQSGTKLTIFLEKWEALPEYMPGGKKIRIHEFLCNLFFPFENDFSFELDFSRIPISFVAENDTFYLGRLNYTTFI